MKNDHFINKKLDILIVININDSQKTGKFSSI